MPWAAVEGDSGIGGGHSLDGDGYGYGHGGVPAAGVPRQQSRTTSGCTRTEEPGHPRGGVLAFRWREQRTPGKTGLFSLFGTRYQVGPQLARRRIDVYFDPEALDEVGVHHGGQFVERCTHFEVREHHRPRPKAEPPATGPDAQTPLTTD